MNRTPEQIAKSVLVKFNPNATQLKSLPVPQWAKWAQDDYRQLVAAVTEAQTEKRKSPSLLSKLKARFKKSATVPAPRIDPDATATYQHHGRRVTALSSVKGQHRSHCLCFNACVHFKPGTPGNCVIAQATYDNCRSYGIVTPVYECPKYRHS